MSGQPRTIELRLPGRAAAAKALPPLLRTQSRAAAGAADPFVNSQSVLVEAVFELSAPGRGGVERQTLKGTDQRLLALEASDGTTLFLRADKLLEDLARLHPGAVKDGVVDLELVRDPQAASRGMPDWIWSKLSVLVMGKDGIVDAAREQAVALITDWLGEKAQDLAEAGASWLGAKTLMWAIESRLPGEPGLYRWRGAEVTAADRLAPGAPGLVEAAEEGPLLVFIHGTGSHTAASFADLRSRGPATDWEALTRPFGDRVFGFEHRTFSESPIENAVALATNLPDGARLSLVTHARGGLVGDLLCLADLPDRLIDQYQHVLPPGQDERQRALRDKLAAMEQSQLRELRRLLQQKNFRIERYVRVACPAQGTALLSDNLEVFLSSLLSLMGTLVGGVAGPAAGAVFSAFKRIALEIADKRVDPHLVPGLEAMLVDAPMAALLARASRKQGVQLAVIAGDIEGGSLLARIAVMFTDWMFFDSFANDLVVDTRSMYGGLAARAGAYALFDDGPEVHHFAYFRNPLTRGAVRDWLATDSPQQLAVFRPVEVMLEPTPEQVKAKSTTRAAPEPGTRPVAILLPDTMGSHLQRVAKPGHRVRVWFDFGDLAAGGLGKIRYGEDGVEQDGLFEMFYGDLANHLEHSREVVRFAYDWRDPVETTAERLAKLVTDKLGETAQQQLPVCLLAHGMGGLVVRAMIAANAGIWDQIVARPGGRLVMLGTPNNGSHLMVETLLGKSDTIRKLARLGAPGAMQGVLDIVAGFPGALQLLPRPGFKDTANRQRQDYFDRAVWDTYRKSNRDRWFGDGIAGVPADADLKKAKALWDSVLPDTAVAHPERVAYVYGQAPNTPCGVDEREGVPKMVGTPRGDGSVTWLSGQLEGLPDDRYWYMPVGHGDLADSEQHFPAIVDLLQSGTTDKLGRIPQLRGADEVQPYEALPTAYPTDVELARSLLGAKRRRREAARKTRTLEVSVKAMDLRFAQFPVLCGHYIGDAISGAEAQIDQYLVDRALTQRHRLGLYAGEIATSAVVLKVPTQEETRRATGKGAVVIGLGEYGKLSMTALIETVRAGVLRYLLAALDREGSERAGASQEPRSLRLLSLLLGYNSTTNISIEASVEAVVRGVCEANRQFEDAMGARLRVGRLEFIELFLDTAVSAAHAVRDLPKRLAKDLQRLKIQIQAAQQLSQGDGVRPRLSVGSSSNYWPRLIITDADRPEDMCPPECYQVRTVSPIPPEVLRELLDRNARAEKPESDEAGSVPSPAASGRTALSRPVRTLVADRLKFVYLGERARAETTVQQRQPGLIEAMLRDAVRVDSFNRDISRTLFQLMIPLDFKGSTRQAERLVLVLDRYTANLPWEMLQADDEPLVTRMAVVRQLVSTRYRALVRSALDRTACVIGNPSTEGYLDHFGDPSKPNRQPLPSLTEAEKEADAVHSALQRAGYVVRVSPPGSAGADVLNRLFEAPYRILMIAAHGEVDLLARDGKTRTGVVLSDGIMLTAAEVGQMEVVPQLVFLNCCHLAKVEAAPSYNRLAASLAGELIDMGVRCVIAAGWKVNDEAACVFAEVFFEQMVGRGKPFGEAVWNARKATYERFAQLNTWGAYQAYGDPAFVLDPSSGGDGERSEWTFVAPQELIDRLSALRADCRHDRQRPLRKAEAEADGLLRRSPSEWRDLPEVQFALGELFAEFIPAGYERASTAYLRSIAEEARGATVPVRAIEQLANLEARTGESREPPEPTLIDCAIRRLTGLLDISQRAPQGGGQISPAAEDASGRRNAERWALLGSAHKRKAAVMAMEQSATWQTVQEPLTRSRDAYAMAAGEIAAADGSLYAILNGLQLDGLLGGLGTAQIEERLKLVEECAATARKRFADSYDFFDAVMPADAMLAALLLQGAVAASAQVLEQVYSEAVQEVPRTGRQIDSVTKQLRLLAQFLVLRAGTNDAKAADVLRTAAERLEPYSRSERAAKPAPPRASSGTESAKLAGEAAQAAPSTTPKPGAKAKKTAATRRKKRGG